MAAFASDRRSGWVRVLVLILCALFIFAVIATPPAFALSETVALFTAASVLSAAVAALGFKLSSDAEGQATLNQMVQDFSAVSWSLGLVAVGDKVNGLIKGVQYIKMQVLNGKTYLDERILAWCQQWLGAHGVYDSGSIIGSLNPFNSAIFNSERGTPASPVSGQAVSVSSFLVAYGNDTYSSNWAKMSIDNKSGIIFLTRYALYVCPTDYIIYSRGGNSYGFMARGVSYELSIYYLTGGYNPSDASWNTVNVISSGQYAGYSNITETDSYTYTSLDVSVSSSNDTGLSGTDTIGADYKDKTLDQILDGLKDWAQDWYDAGADSATNTVAGAKDLPLTVGEQAASANPALNPDVVYNPPFALPLPSLHCSNNGIR